MVFLSLIIRTETLALSNIPAIADKVVDVTSDDEDFHSIQTYCARCTYFEYQPTLIILRQLSAKNNIKTQN